MIVKLEVPGVEKDQLHVSVTEDEVTVRGETRSVSRGVAAVLLDGVPLAEPVLPRLDDSRLHEVEVTMG